MQYLNDVWNVILPNVNWVVFTIVIGFGYLITKTKSAVNWQWPTIIKILAVTLPAALIYGFLKKIDPGVWFASYCIAFGFHAVILKPLEIAIKSIGGGGVSDPTK